MPAPKRELPPAEWEHHQLYQRVRNAVYALPVYFRTETSISGIPAQDIFTLGSALGATIEDQAVQALNGMRPIWDPEEKYKLYSFARQGQTFPDVLLRSKENGVSIIMGIELKGWYLLAKESEPNFRYAVTKDACSPQDLVVVVPWALSNILSGSPVIFPPFVESAQYVAEYRNYYWQELRQTESSTEIEVPERVTPYPKKSDKIADKPMADSGSNYGRIARTGMMDEYVQTAMNQTLRGIPAKDWVHFFRDFSQ